MTISLVQGDALGGGWEGALSACYVMAETHARFGFPEPQFGLFPGMGAHSFLSRRIGPVPAERLIMSGRTFEAAELHAMHIVDHVFARGTGETEVIEFIRRNRRHAASLSAMGRIRQIVSATSLRDEMRQIVDVWLETAHRLSDADLRNMKRFLRAQQRLRAAGETQAGLDEMSESNDASAVRKT